MTHKLKGNDIAHAILAINPSAQFIVNAEDFDRITWYNNTTPISKADIEAKQVELRAIQVSHQYENKRSQPSHAGGYPDIDDQLDMMWHDKKDGTTTWEDAIQAVKDANPKP